MGEQIGHVNTGLSEDSISKQLKTRSYLSSGTIINLEEAGCPEKEVDFCIICQVTYNLEMFSVNNLSLFVLICDHSVDIGSIYHLGLLILVAFWISQDFYKNQEKIGTLHCGHEYHADCLKKWLLVKNVCPICKSEALITGKKNV